MLWLKVCCFHSSFFAVCGCGCGANEKIKCGCGCGCGGNEKIKCGCGSGCGANQKTRCGRGVHPPKIKNLLDLPGPPGAGPAPGGAFAPARIPGPGPGGVFAPATFAGPASRGPAGGGALPGPTSGPGLHCKKRPKKWVRRPQKNVFFPI